MRRRDAWDGEDLRVLKMLMERKVMEKWSTATFVQEARKWLPHRTSASITVKFYKLRKEEQQQ